MRFALFRDWVMPEYRAGAIGFGRRRQPIEKNGKIAERAIFDLATFRRTLTN